MAKSRTPPVVPTSTGPLKHSPFAGLGGAKPPVAEPLDEGPVAVPALRFERKVVVRRETKGRSGKTITRIGGLPATHREELLQSMKRALGCGGTVEDEDVVLLGSLVDRAADWLEARGARRVVRSS